MRDREKERERFGPTACRHCGRTIRRCVKAGCNCRRWIHVQDDCGWCSDSQRAEPVSADNKTLCQESRSEG